MSVQKFNNEKIQQIANGLFSILDEDKYNYFWRNNFQEDTELIKKAHNIGESEAKRTAFQWFMIRIGNTNNFAYYTQYNEIGSKTELKKLSYIEVNKKALLKELDSLTYNLADNNGRIYITSEDNKTLEVIENILLREILKDVKQ